MRRVEPLLSAPAVQAVLRRLVCSLYAVPIVILYPVFTAWFGVGPESKIAFALLARAIESRFIVWQSAGKEAPRGAGAAVPATV